MSLIMISVAGAGCVEPDRVWNAKILNDMETPIQVEVSLFASGYESQIHLDAGEANILRDARCGSEIDRLVLSARLPNDTKEAVHRFDIDCNGEEFDIVLFPIPKSNSTVSVGLGTILLDKTMDSQAAKELYLENRRISFTRSWSEAKEVVTVVAKITSDGKLQDYVEIDLEPDTSRPIDAFVYCDRASTHFTMYAVGPGKGEQGSLDDDGPAGAYEWCGTERCIDLYDFGPQWRSDGEPSRYGVVSLETKHCI